MPVDTGTSKHMDRNLSILNYADHVFTLLLVN